MVTTKYFGGPGTGKTTTMLNELDLFLATYPLNKICYITYTRSAKRDVIERVKKKYPNIQKEDLYFFATQHSVCYRLLGLKREDIVREEDKQNLCKKMGITYELPNKTKQVEEVLAGGVEDTLDSGREQGNLAFGLYSKIILSGNTPTVSSISFQKDDLEDLTLGNEILFELYEKYTKWKHETGKYDFNDMLKKVIERKLHPNVDVLIVDEFQDFGELQYQVYSLWKQQVNEVRIAGDDDQSIYAFLSANPKYLLNEPGEEKILKTNHRTPEDIFAYATTFIKQNNFRKAKDIICSNKGGIILEVNGDTITKEFWKNMFAPTVRRFFLVRTNYFAKILSQTFDDNLIPYHIINRAGVWSSKMVYINNLFYKYSNNNPIPFHEIKAFLSDLPVKGTLKRGVKKEIKSPTPIMREPMLWKDWVSLYFVVSELHQTPEDILPKVVNKNQMKLRIGEKHIEEVTNYIGTMHSSKGLEADEVYLFDSLPYKVWENLEDKSDLESERRVYYVAMTRAKQKLVVIYDFFDNTKGSFIEGGW